MLFLDSELEKYILDHSDPEDSLLYDLYRQTNLKVYHPRMMSGHLQGKILASFVSMIRPENILEIGTYTGYSAICMARGMKEGAHLHTIEANDEIEEFTRSYFKKGGLEDKITMYIGDAREIIPKFDIEFDMVFIDGEKDQYIEYYDAVFDKVTKGGFIIADNVLWSGKVIEKELEVNDHFTKGILAFNKKIKRDKRVENVIFPVRDGLMVMRKK